MAPDPANSTRRRLLQTAVTVGAVSAAGCANLSLSSDSESPPPYFYGVEVCNHGTDDRSIQTRVERDGDTVLDETQTYAPQTAGTSPGVVCREFTDAVGGIPVAETDVSIRVGDGEWQTVAPELPTENESMECVLLHVEAHPDDIEATYWVPLNCPEPVTSDSG